MAKETYYTRKSPDYWQVWGIVKCPKRPWYIWQKSPIHMAKEPYSYGKRALFIWQKRPIEISLSEVFINVKRALFIWQKRPITHERDLQIYWQTWGMHEYQKRHINLAKEPYSYGKRALFIWQKRHLQIDWQTWAASLMWYVRDDVICKRWCDM